MEMADVTTIEPVIVLSEPTIPQRQKVAAYVRVSTDHDEQMGSFEAQTEYYTKKINENIDWDFAGIYSDCGLSGTSHHQRDGFNRMIEDCRAGRITVILTKSISRFARNTVDTIRFVRELKELNIGVMFEKENIWSMDPKSEFILSLMSALAQEESRSLSENVNWGIRRKMEKGLFTVGYSRFLGYDKGDEESLTINQEEAAIVRLIYALCYKGFRAVSICNELSKRGIYTVENNEHWNSSSINGVLTNEKYKGDALLQKTYIPNFLTKKRKRNKGELPQYYVSGSHEAIIEPELWDHIQEIITERNREDRRYSSTAAYAGKLVCGCCGNFYVTRIWHNVDDVWSCKARDIREVKCKNIHLYDYALHYYIKRIMVSLTKKRDCTIAQFIQIIERHVPSEERLEDIKRFLKGLSRENPDNLVEGDEPLYIFESITVGPGDYLTAKTFDGMLIKQEVKRYSPRRGWQKTPTKEYKRSKTHPCICQSCGNTFMSANKNAKYCCRPCFIKKRFGGA